MKRRLRETSRRLTSRRPVMADTGEGTVTSARANPHLAQALSGLEDASTRLDQRVEAVADELHDSSEELLGWVDVTRSAAGRWARWPTPHRTRLLLRTISHRPTPGNLTLGSLPR